MPNALRLVLFNSLSIVNEILICGIFLVSLNFAEHGHLEELAVSHVVDGKEMKNSLVTVVTALYCLLGHRI